MYVARDHAYLGVFLLPHCHFVLDILGVHDHGHYGAGTESSRNGMGRIDPVFFRHLAGLAHEVLSLVGGPYP